MSTVFETRLIGNLGRDATMNRMDRGVVAINFPVAHNRNWRDRRSGEQRTKTTWVNCTIWKRDDSNLRILDLLKKGTLVELLGTPVAKIIKDEHGESRAEIRLNVSQTNILRNAKNELDSIHENGDGMKNDAVPSSMEDMPDMDF